MHRLTETIVSDKLIGGNFIQLPPQTVEPVAPFLRSMVPQVFCTRVKFEPFERSVRPRPPPPQVGEPPRHLSPQLLRRQSPGRAALDLHGLAARWVLVL